MNSFTEAYRRGISELLETGHTVPSVLDPMSTASGFGTANRPSVELLNYSFEVDHGASDLVLPDSSPYHFHFAYAAALIAWSLDGRQDLATLEHYRSAATEYSDDGLNLCGAFGERMFCRPGPAQGQLDAVLQRLRDDPSSRRTFVPILEPHDNVGASLEYPCAAGIQLFVRNGKLHMWVVMRAQQALTVLPYDYLLFAYIHLYLAGRLELLAGRYMHTAGTFHIYESERDIARDVLRNKLTFNVPTEIGNAEQFRQELVKAEQRLRLQNSAHSKADGDAGQAANVSPALRYWRKHLAQFAESTSSGAEAVVEAGLQNTRHNMTVDS